MVFFSFSFFFFLFDREERGEEEKRREGRGNAAVCLTGAGGEMLQERMGTFVLFPFIRFALHFGAEKRGARERRERRERGCRNALIKLCL